MERLAQNPFVSMASNLFGNVADMGASALDWFSGGDREAETSDAFTGDPATSPVGGGGSLSGALDGGFDYPMSEDADGQFTGGAPRLRVAEGGGTIVELGSGWQGEMGKANQRFFQADIGGFCGKSAGLSGNNARFEFRAGIDQIKAELAQMSAAKDAGERDGARYQIPARFDGSPCSQEWGD